MAAEESFDVVVIGSGSAGCSAALRSARGGLRVVVIEKSDRLGGTSAMSGAGIWIGANHVEAREGIEDSYEETIDYIRRAAPPGWAETEDGLWEAFARNGSKMLKFVEENTPMTLRIIEEPDPMAELPAASCAGAWSRRCRCRATCSAAMPSGCAAPPCRTA